MACNEVPASMLTAGEVDSITAATRLRREIMEVHRELEEKQREYNARMARVREQEEELQIDRSKLQDTLVQYYKYIQENETKRARANKKAQAEEKARQERVVQINALRERISKLDSEREEAEREYMQNVRYQQYLEDVLHYNDSEEYQDPKDIVRRFEILDDNTKVLQKRKTQLEEDLGRAKMLLHESRTRRKNEVLEMQNQLSDLQSKLEAVQKTIKAKQDELEVVVSEKRGLTKVVGHVKLVCENLYQRCIEWNPQYKTRATNKEVAHGVLHQLDIIGDCLLNCAAIIKQHNENLSVGNVGKTGMIRGSPKRGSPQKSMGKQSPIRKEGLSRKTQ